MSLERMTWGEFKRRLEAAGVTDDATISYIDVGRLYVDDVIKLYVEVTDDGNSPTTKEFSAHD